MFVKRETEEVTGANLADEFDAVKTEYQEAVASLAEDADQRQQVVRHRLSVLESEDTLLATLQTSLASA